MSTPTPTIKTIALAGASGTFGTTLLTALFSANFTVTALTRPGTTHTFPSGVRAVPVDYSSVSDLTSALQGQDALISTLGYAGMLSQTTLIDAAVAAGVKRIIPSEYGSDPNNANARALPVFGHKVAVEQHLKAAVAANPSTTYTLVCNNEFFDWDLDHHFGVDIPSRKIEIFDGGDVPFTATPLSFVAAGVVSVLQNPDKTANRVIRLHGAVMTQNRLLALLKRFTGDADGWSVTHSSTVEREGEAYAALQRDPGDFAVWAVMMLQCAVWGAKFGNDFSGENDNEMLGLRELGEGEIEEIVRARC